MTGALWRFIACLGETLAIMQAPTWRVAVVVCLPGSDHLGWSQIKGNDMFRIFSIAILIILSSMRIAVAGEDIRVYAMKYHGVTFTAYERESGGSGYLTIGNNTPYDLRICWTIHFANAAPSRGCKLRFESGDVQSSSCFNCSRRNGGGVTDIEIREYEYRN